MLCLQVVAPGDRGQGQGEAAVLALPFEEVGHAVNSASSFSSLDINGQQTTEASAQVRGRGGKAGATPCPCAESCSQLT